ncbi:MAG: hypothetical protein JWO62_2920 [Acidimicrobiaceae bacterium]|jgi:hypothetical protein|nr:hypothetical protein [Acidimicrobiaceae bacterium]
MRRGPAPAGSEADVDGGPVGSVAVETELRPPASPPVAERVDELRTEFDFVLPRGYVDSSGTVHRDGTMRLATARDELLPLHDDRVRANPPYLTVVLLARVITRLGSLAGDSVSVNVVENLFASDLAFLQDLYRRVNSEGHTLAAVTCPACNERFSVDLAGGRLGES